MPYVHPHWLCGPCARSKKKGAHRSHKCKNYVQAENVNMVTWCECLSHANYWNTIILPNHLDSLARAQARLEAIDRSLAKAKHVNETAVKRLRERGLIR